ncbi:alpha/beta fold hydrolase [Nocardioides marmoribigeumensis]|uniref:Polyhydroxyalkanoate synthase n=1 Tax=Nocardioides marmoribigeumensis TaxID=433649 RepID=A0ABU2BXY4_9ACTN|nr:alpha/beta fold hydrolase [Nocardioides marmoribigeumensis]MDR7363271.1 polyhydroxyalkanoate synthase [Nocardioides marmoribigeumensis]
MAETASGATTSVLRTPAELVDRIRRDVARNALRARNGIRVVTGAGRPETGLTPKDTVWEQGSATMWRYRSDRVTQGPPLLIVFSLVSQSYILDLVPGNSFVEHLRDDGFDVFLVDWGTAGERESRNGLEDYAERLIPEVLDRVCDLTGSPDVALVGYCFGGLLTLMAAAADPELPLASLTTIATPVDFTDAGVLTDALGSGDLSVDEALDEEGNVPPHVLLQYFRLMKPTAELAQYANILDRLLDDDKVAAHQLMTGWATDHVPFPGRTARQVVDLLVGDNSLLEDTFRLDGRPVSLRDIRVPYLNVVAARDHIVPPASARPALDLVGSEDKQELLLDAGHIGLAVGRKAHQVTIPQISEFLRARSRPVEETR